MNAIQPNLTGEQDAFVTKLNLAGNTLVYSTYLGGSGTNVSGYVIDFDQGCGIAVDASGNAYVTGTTDSPDFPAIDPIQATLTDDGDAFATELTPAGSGLVFSTYLGGQRRCRRQRHRG